MAVEEPRGCGYRKVGGFYLVAGPGGVMKPCDRLPFTIENCPVCGGGLKFTRGWTWLDWLKYAGTHQGHLVDIVGGMEERERCTEDFACPVCAPSGFKQPYGLLWVGEQFYTPEEFRRESYQLGVSRRLPYTGETPRPPKGIKLGESWVLFAFKNFKKIGVDEKGKDIYESAIFHAFKPERFELLLWQSEAVPERLEELVKAGVTPVIIPDGDKDHDPATPIGLSPEAKVDLDNSLNFSSLRARIGKK